MPESRIQEWVDILQRLAKMGGQLEQTKIVPNCEVMDIAPANLPAGYILVEDKDGYQIPAVVVAGLTIAVGDMVNVLYITGTEAIVLGQGTGSSATGSGWPFSKVISVDPIDIDADYTTITLAAAAVVANDLILVGNVATYVEATIGLAANVSLAFFDNWNVLLTNTTDDDLLICAGENNLDRLNLKTQLSLTTPVYCVRNTGTDTVVLNECRVYSRNTHGGATADAYAVQATTGIVEGHDSYLYANGTVGYALRALYVELYDCELIGTGYGLYVEAAGEADVYGGFLEGGTKGLYVSAGATVRLHNLPRIEGGITNLGTIEGAWIDESGNITSVGEVLIQPAADDTDVFRVLNSAGTGIVLQVDTTNRYVGIDVVPASPLHIDRTPAVDTSLILIRGMTYQNTVNDLTRAARGMYLQTSKHVAAGKTDSGYIYGVHSIVMRNYLAPDNDDGTLGAASVATGLHGEYIQYGHYNTNAFDPQTINVTGITVYPYIHTGDITNLYGILVASGEGTAGTTVGTCYGVRIQNLVSTPTVTTYWGLYQDAYTGGKNYLGNQVLIGDTTDADVTLGLTINQGAADDKILTLKSSDIAHGITDWAETDTFGYLTKALATTGGLRITGLGETSVGVVVNGYVTAADATRSTAAIAPFYTLAALKSGTGVASMGADQNIACFSDNGIVRFILDSDGDSHQDVGTAWTNFDEQDDLELLTALSTQVSKPEDPIRRNFAEFLSLHHDELQRLKLVTFNDDGHHFVNMSKLTMLLVGVLRQQGEKLTRLEQSMLLLKGRG